MIVWKYVKNKYFFKQRAHAKLILYILQPILKISSDIFTPFIVGVKTQPIRDDPPPQISVFFLLF